MAFCNCSSGLSNLGKPSCSAVGSVAKKLIYVPLRDSQGRKNLINSTDVINESYVEAKINADPSERWYFSPYIENVEDTKGDSTFESLNSGSNIFVTEGARTFNGMYIKEGSTFLGKLKSGKCIDFGVYTVDIDGNLTGSMSADGLNLYPIAVDKETFNPVLMKATDTTVEKVSVSFEFSRAERDENLRSISSNDISVDLLSYNGLVDAKVDVFGDVSTGGVLNCTVSTDYGSFGNPIMVEGLIASNFSIAETTTPTTISIDSVTETSDGNYTLIYSFTPTGGELGILTVTIAGFDIPASSIFAIL